MDSKLLNYAKMPIPILANSSPHCYVIMPALLSNNDAELPTPFQFQQNFNYHTTTPIRNKTLKTTATTDSQHSTFPTNCSTSAKSPSTDELVNVHSHQSDNLSTIFDLNNNEIANSRSNKELIYATKHMTLQSDQNNIHDSQSFTSSFINSSPFDCLRLNNQRIDQTIAENIEHILHTDNMALTNQQTLFKKPHARKTQNHINSSKYVNSCSVNPTVNTHKADSLINMPGVDSSSFFTDSQAKKCIDPTFSDSNSSFSTFDNQLYYNQSDMFSDKPDNKALQTEQSSDSELFKKTSDESASAARPAKENCTTEESPVVTYTISCSPEWQLDLSRMVNCFVLFKDIGASKKLSAVSENVTLKCGVCRMVFYSLGDLASHKRLNNLCQNSVNIEEEISENQGQNKKRKRKKYPTKITYSMDLMPSTSLNKSYYEDEDQEELMIEDSLEELDGEDSDASSEEFIDDETLQLNLFESALKNNLNLKKKLMTTPPFKRNKLLLDLTYNQTETIGQSETLMSLNEEFARSNNQNEKTSKPRRKYNKNKSDHINQLSCEHCNKTCRTRAELLVHLHKHSGNEPECWVCGKTCASFSNLVSHVQLHTGEKPYTCQFCGKQFTQDAHLTRHIRLHTGERPFVCNICGKNYKDYSYYKTHLRIHRGERLYKCNYCGKEYYDASYYKKHTRLHTGEKPYMCTICGKQFHRSDYLKLHSYSHTDERPFHCHICGKGFKMNYNLKVHLKNHDHELSNATIISSNEDTTTFNLSESSMNSNNIELSLINTSESNSLNFMDSLQDNDINVNNRIKPFIATEGLVNSHQQSIGQSMNFNASNTNNISANEMVSYIVNTNEDMNRPINLAGSTRNFVDNVAKIKLMQSHIEDNQMFGSH